MIGSGKWQRGFIRRGEGGKNRRRLEESKEEWYGYGDLIAEMGRRRCTGSEVSAEGDGRRAKGNNRI